MVIEEKIIGDYIVTVKYDDSPENPREWYNMGKMVCFDKRYSLGDKHYYNPNDYNSFEELKKDILKNEKVGVILPLYLYEHGGVCVKTSPFSCSFDSRQIGFIFSTREEILKNFRGKILTEKLKTSVEKCLQKEVEVYSQYLNGEIYGYEITKNGKYFDSTYGYYDKDECLNDGISMINN